MKPYLAILSARFRMLLQYRAAMLWDAIGYVDPWAVFGKEINEPSGRRYRAIRRQANPLEEE